MEGTKLSSTDKLSNGLNGKYLTSDSYAKYGSTMNQFKMNESRILMIEDDIDLAQLIRHFLVKKFDCQVDLAADPFEAMNFMNDKFYNLIVLDWNLPELNGGETLKVAAHEMAYDPLLSAQWDFQEVPVVVFSSETRDNCILKKTKHFNCAGFVSKTQPLTEIIDSLSFHIENNSIQKNLAV